MWYDTSGYFSTWRFLFVSIVFDIVPLILSIWIVKLGNTIYSRTEFIDYLLLSCSIFAGLLFSLIIVIVDKAKKIKEEKSTKNQDDFYYLSRYLRFSKELITKISYAIITCIVIILIICIRGIDLGVPISYLVVNKPEILSLILFYFSIQFGILIINIISDMYAVFSEEIGNQQ